jgi:prolyl oligopeptidase
MRAQVAVLALLILACGSGSAAQAQAVDAPDATDPFQWLEDVHGTRATEWVKSENAKTLDVLRQDPHFARFYSDALAVTQAKGQIEYPSFLNGKVYNFTRGGQHVRGLWRVTTSASYRTAKPAWKAIFDLDFVAKNEGKNWVWGGADCASPSRKHCLVFLSDGGEDAVSVREFDPEQSEFVEGGFVLPRGKQSVAWASDDAILVSREWEPGDLTSASYPFIVKRLERGKPLAAGIEVFRGTKSDVNVRPFSLSDGDGRRILFVRRALNTLEAEIYIITPDGPRRLAIPLKAALGPMVAGRLVIRLGEEWLVDGRSFPTGASVSVELADVLANPAHLNPALIYAPGPREASNGVAATRDALVVATTENVKGAAFVYTPAAGETWTKRRLDLPEDLTVEIGPSDREGTTACLYLSGFLTPLSLVFADTVSGVLTTVKSNRPAFDASNEVVEQHFATSSDGTQVPYFVVRPRALKYDGTNPTILYGYGGFGVSLTPDYDGVLGKLWLERGGVYVLANIRGGGEFGPAWHEAGLKTHRQLVYDDFTAIARELIAQGITSPPHLGIQGGSNGGLLMGVELTQHPELWNAVDIEVPLLDMLRYEKIEAGASWIGEYGSVSNPVERAFLASISPYDNLKAGVSYPEPFIWTTSNDDRVGPEHARKFAAKLASLGDPYLFYEVVDGGHGAGANTTEATLTTALAMTYFARRLGN